MKICELKSIIFQKFLCVFVPMSITKINGSIVNKGFD